MKLSLPVLLLLLLPLTACSHRNRVSKEGEDVEAGAPVVVHPHIDDRIRLVKYRVQRTEDGRLAIQVVLESRSRKELPVILTTDWIDDEGRIVERSDERQALIASGGTYVHEDTSWTKKPVRFSLAVRPAATKRKR